MHRVRMHYWLWFVGFVVSVTAAWAKPAKPRTKTQLAPKVVLTSPVGGWTSSRIVTVAGHISDRSLKRATLVINGAPKGLPVNGGRFSTKIVLGPGANTLRVVAQNARGVGTRGVTVFAKVPSKALKIILTWDTNRTDVDMWVIGPKGEKCYYRHKQTKIGGHLDTDVTNGYGPETYTLSHAVPGPYQVIAHYFSSRGGIPTQVRLEVIRHEGTPRESRRIYRGVLTTNKQELRVAVINVQ